MTDPFEQLADEQRGVDPPSATSTAAARLALLDHIDREVGRIAEATSSARRTPGRWPARSVMVGVAAAGLAVVGVGSMLLDRLSSPEVVIVETPAASGPQLADAVDVDELIARLSALGQPDGNATLLERLHGSEGAGRSGVDVFSDDGSYGYGTTVERALTAVASDEQRSWPVSVGLRDALIDVATAAPPDPARQFVELVLTEEGRPHGAGDVIDVEAQAWLRLLTALPLLPASPEATVGALLVLDALPDVQLVAATIDGSEVVVAVRTTDDGAERVFFEPTRGAPIRYDRLSASGRVEAKIDYTVRRIELDS